MPPDRAAPAHLSHSSRETLERCAKSWFLKYMTRAPRSQSLWLAGGSAVHETTELYDLLSFSGDERIFETERIWAEMFTAQVAYLRTKEPNENAWRKSAAEPLEVWQRIGLQFVQAYIDWRERSAWEIWTTPDGKPAIELDVSGYLPGCPVEIKAYLDRIFWDPLFKKHWIVDLKTSKRPPKDATQFGVYRALVKVKYGIDVHDGVAFMNRKGALSKPFDLSEHTPEFVGAVFGEAWEQIQRGEFPAEGIAKNDCFLCDVQSACAAKGGPDAHLYDPDSPGHISNQPPY